VDADIPPRNEHAWERAVIGSDAYYGLVLASTIAAVIAGSGGGGPAAGQVLAVAALAAMAPWYIAVGRPAGRGVPVRSRTTWYVFGLILLLGTAQAVSAWSSLALFALVPQCFILLPAWRATAAVAAFNLVPVLRLADDPGSALWAAVIAAGLVAFAATFGRWIIRIIEQSRERADLVAALARTRTELARAEHEAGALAERQRLAGEIHDTIAQGFTSILMLLHAADAAATPEQGKTYLSQAARTAQENLTEARGLIAAQPPTALNGSSLSQALGRLAAQLAEETGIAAEYGATGGARWLPSATEVVMLRSAQEAMSNVRRHSCAATVTLRLDYRDDSVALCVSDDGTGFDPSRTRGAGLGGMGLAGMDRRAAAAGGALRVRSSPGTGTTVTVELPA
jgi:signal transduction histidine kinase